MKQLYSLVGYSSLLETSLFGVGNAHVQFGELHGETLFRTNAGVLL